MHKIQSTLIFAILMNWMDPFGLAKLVAVKELRIPEAQAEHVEKVYTSCACKNKCYVINCTTYSVTKPDDGTMECRMSMRPVPRYLWESDPNSYTVHKSDYTASGGHFYRDVANSSRDRRDANDTCFSDGGQLPVLLDSATTDEFRSIMSHYGVEQAWVGAFREYSYENGAITGNTPTVWTLANGTTIEDPSIPVYGTYRCFIFDAVSNQMNNSVACIQKIFTICQRDY